MSGWSEETGPIVEDGANGRIYVGTFGGRLYCIDRLTGQEIWMRRVFRSTGGAVAVGHDGTVYFASYGGDDHRMVAFSPDGDQLWVYITGDQVLSSPIVDGDGTIYLCSLLAPKSGHIHAVRPDGTPLWVKKLPNYMGASPMIAPDGTLYAMCGDGQLYAFRDLAGDMNSDGAVNFADVYPFALSITDPNAYKLAFPDGNPALADITEDDRIDSLDLIALLNLINN